MTFFFLFFSEKQSSVSSIFHSPATTTATTHHLMILCLEVFWWFLILGVFFWEGRGKAFWFFVLWNCIIKWAILLRKGDISVTGMRASGKLNVSSKPKHLFTYCLYHRCSSVLINWSAQKGIVFLFFQGLHLRCFDKNVLSPFYRKSV